MGLGFFAGFRLIDCEERGRRFFRQRFNADSSMLGI